MNLETADPEFENMKLNTSTPISKRIKRDVGENGAQMSFMSEFLDGEFSENLSSFDFDLIDKNDYLNDEEHYKEADFNGSCKDDNFLICQSQATSEEHKSNTGMVLNNSSFHDLSPSRNISSNIIRQLKHNTSSSPKVSVSKLKRKSILFALDDAQKIHEQLSQTSVGPFYGLPSKTSLLFKCHRGIGELYEWQQECLLLTAVKERRNLIYSLPTSGGKTLVAEILIMKELLCHLKDAIFVLPYVSLVQEKVRGLSPFAVDLNFVIEEYAGIKGTIPPRRRRKRHTLYICTIEKAHSLINSLIENKHLQEIGLVVVDELHMIGETGGRGSVLESLLTKIMFLSKDTQIIGMSATLNNMKDIKQFLHADIYEKNFRPVELREFIKVDSDLYELPNKKSDEWCFIRSLDFNYTKEMLMRDPDMITGLVMEVVPNNSCLIFCPTKKHCENVAITICHLLPNSILNHKLEEKEALLKALCEEGNGNVCNILKFSIKFGLAYHHSGLTMEERKLIEEAYLNGTLCCLACTSTLAAGVNLPAKRVILRAPYVGIDFITYSRYKQMIGRAGRAGIDSSGESILMMKKSERLKIENLLQSDADVCQSNYLMEPERLQMFILNLVGLQIASKLEDIYNFMNHTLLAVQSRNSGSTPTNIFQSTVDVLCDNGLVQYDLKDGSLFHITDLGKAAFRGHVDIATMHEFIKRLKTGLNGLVLHSHLHLLFLVTPTEFFPAIPLITDLLFRKYNALSAEDINASKHIGITEQMIMLMASGRSIEKNKSILHHFYLTLILYDVWKQNSVWEVSQMYQVHRGVVQNLLNSASALAATLSNFCQELSEYWAYQQLLPNFVKQLSYCVTAELLPLMELPTVKRGRARQLYVAGFKTLTDVARAHPEELVDKINHMPRKTALQIVSAAKMIILEKAEALKEEADLLIEDFDKNCTFYDEIDV